ncbi:MAG: flagellar basal body P-ring protein FlgI [Planctomycetes bacterium]|nr:flagellar basal body P-ring protein FlgI [Planctomycetota bacterium]
MLVSIAILSACVATSETPDEMAEDAVSRAPYVESEIPDLDALDYAVTSRDALPMYLLDVLDPEAKLDFDQIVISGVGFVAGIPDGGGDTGESYKTTRGVILSLNPDTPATEMVEGQVALVRVTAVTESLGPSKRTFDIKIAALGNARSIGPGRLFTTQLVLERNDVKDETVARTYDVIPYEGIRWPSREVIVPDGGLFYSGKELSPTVTMKFRVQNTALMRCVRDALDKEFPGPVIRTAEESETHEDERRSLVQVADEGSLRMEMPSSFVRRADLFLHSLELLRFEFSCLEDERGLLIWDRNRKTVKIAPSWTRLKPGTLPTLNFSATENRSAFKFNIASIDVVTESSQFRRSEIYYENLRSGAKGYVQLENTIAGVLEALDRIGLDADGLERLLQRLVVNEDRIGADIIML